MGPFKKYVCEKSTRVFINNPYWQSSGITIFLCKYIVISDTLIGSWKFFFLFFAVILSELHEKLRRKNWVTETKYVELFMWGTSIVWLHALFPMSFYMPFLWCTPFLSSILISHTEKFCPQKCRSGRDG